MAAPQGDLATAQVQGAAAKWATPGLPGISAAPAVLLQFPPAQGFVPPLGGPAPDCTKQRISTKAALFLAQHRRLRGALASKGLRMAHACLALRRGILLFPFHFFW